MTADMIRKRRETNIVKRLTPSSSLCEIEYQFDADGSAIQSALGRHSFAWVRSRVSRGETTRTVQRAAHTDVCPTINMVICR